MKKSASIAFAGLLLASSITLQGCGILGDNKATKRLEKVVTENSYTARCTEEGEFSCSGPKEWCAQQEKKCVRQPDPECAKKSCTPQCKWECGPNPKCDQVCAPKCGQAICSTRCKHFNTQSCHMKCAQPDCKVVCPKHGCPNGNCPACKTECGKPVCKMECDKPDDQPCRHVCAQPPCQWECQKPKECPKPVCHMTCDTPRSCWDNTRMVSSAKLPPLEPGETEVAFGITDFATKTAGGFLQGGHNGTMRVSIMTMGTDLKLQKSEVDMQLAPKCGTVAASGAWTRMVRKHDGQVKESEASCKTFLKCTGDAAWCTEQEKIVCQHRKVALLQRRSRLQGRLQA